MVNVSFTELLPFIPDGFEDYDVSVFGSAMNYFGDEINNNYKIISIKKFSIIGASLKIILLNVQQNEILNKILTNDVRSYIKNHYEKNLKNKYPELYYFIDNINISIFMIGSYDYTTTISGNIIYLIKK